LAAGHSALAILLLSTLSDLSRADINADNPLTDPLFAIVDESLSIFSAFFPPHIEPSKG
jgi:hypothetical protein